MSAPADRLSPAPDVATTGALLRLVPSLPLFVGLAAFARAVADRSALLNDPDTYLHIAAGRWMLAHGSLPLADPFSHTMPGAAWLASEWLGELTMALTYAVGGWSGVSTSVVCRPVMLPPTSIAFSPTSLTARTTATD